MKSGILVYLSLIFCAFCVQFDYLVSMCMEKYYGEIFYKLEDNLLIKQTLDINVLLIPFIGLLLIYAIYRVVCYLIFKSNYTVKAIDFVFIVNTILVGTCHLMGGLSWFINGWF